MDYKYTYKELNKKEIIKVLEECRYCRLAVADMSKPYIIPMYYSFKYIDGNLIFTLFSQDSGRKMNYIKSNDIVTLEFDRETNDGVESIVAEGYAAITDSDTYAFCTEKNVVMINIVATEVHGRRYRR